MERPQPEPPGWWEVEAAQEGLPRLPAMELAGELGGSDVDGE
jgi:hypothetical protein